MSSVAKTSGLLDSLSEVESLMLLPDIPSHVAKAESLLMRIARAAPHGPIGHLAMEAISTIRHLDRPAIIYNNRVRDVLKRVRTAIEASRAP